MVLCRDRLGVGDSREKSQGSGKGTRRGPHFPALFLPIQQPGLTASSWILTPWEIGLLPGIVKQKGWEITREVNYHRARGLIFLLLLWSGEEARGLCRYLLCLCSARSAPGMLLADLGLGVQGWAEAFLGVPTWRCLEKEKIYQPLRGFGAVFSSGDTSLPALLN